MWFIYENLLKIDNEETLKNIVNIFSQKFNFSKETFENFVFNINNKFLFSNIEFNFVLNFNGEKYNNNKLPNDNFYSYNTLSNLYKINK